MLRTTITTLAIILIPINRDWLPVHSLMPQPSNNLTHQFAPVKPNFNTKQNNFPKYQNFGI